MYILMNLNINNIINFIKFETFFVNFEQVFLFGSFLKDDGYYNDIDLLLLYNPNISDFPSNSNTIKEKFYDLYKVKLDLIILNYDEEMEISFLNKIGKVVKIK